MPPSREVYDVVVIGAGLIGALIARRLAQEALNVAVLEASESPGGIAPRGVGLALLGTPTPYATLQEKVGAEEAEEIWYLTQENLQILNETLQQLEQEGRRVGSFRPISSSAEVNNLQQSVDQLEAEGYEVDIDDATELGYLVALVTKDDIAFDPQQMIEALLVHPNITVETETEVQEIHLPESETTPLTVWARKRYIWAKGIVLAGGAHAVHLSRFLGSIVHPLRITSVDLRNSETLFTPLVLEHGSGIIQSEEGRWRLVGWDPIEQAPLKHLTEIAQQLCPNSPVLGRQSAWVAQSADDLPLIGELPDLPGVYAVSGLGPWGLSWAFVAAQRLVALMIHDVDPGLLAFDRLSKRD
ncbi:MAG: FAD-dependent oxidoreductase [Chloroflexi bacterium]|jgi:glycine/D-amino acid oxidase-like deaminating enzyme|nr:FAD-dependent oxidoreductase [Chloroflexota bacterium]